MIISSTKSFPILCTLCIVLHVQTVQLQEGFKLGYPKNFGLLIKFSEIYCLKCRCLLLEGSRGMPPQAIFKSRGSNVLTQRFLSKTFSNLIATFDISCSFFSFFGTSELSILHFVFYENLTKISHHESKSGFFLSRSHIDRDLGFSSKIGIIQMKLGWLDSPLFTGYIRLDIYK